MTNLLRRLAFLFTWVLLSAYLCLPALSQPIPEPVQYPINIGWFPKTVSYAPDESTLVVTACTDTWKSTKPQRCTVMRYRIAEERWETLPAINPDANYDDVAYTWDGSAIFAQEYARCEGHVQEGKVTRDYCSRLVLLDHDGKKLKNLSHDLHNLYTYPSLTRDGQRVLYWGISNQLKPGMGGGAWDVKELDLASQTTVQKTDYQAAYPKTTPRYMPDGKRLMLVASDYPKRPNSEDFYVTDERTGRRFLTNYEGRYGGNMTVAVSGPRDPILPLFPTDGHMWLMVRDISRDGKRAVFDNRGIGMCFRLIEEPLRKEECFTHKVAYTPSVSIAPSGKTVAVINGADKPTALWHLRLIDVQTGSNQIIAMRFAPQSQ